MLICQVAPLLQIFLLKACITNPKEQSSSWEANRSSAGQKIPCILWNSEVHYRTHNNLCTSVRATCYAQFIVHPTILRELRIVKNREAKKGILTTNWQTACCDIYYKTTVDLYGVHLCHHTDTLCFFEPTAVIQGKITVIIIIIIIILHKLGPVRPVSTSQNIPTHKTGPRTVKK